MPVYSFKCPECGMVIDKYLSMRNKPDLVICVCGGTAVRSFVDELVKPQIFEVYWDANLCNDDYPNGRLCTGKRQKMLAMHEMGFTQKDDGKDMNKKELHAWRYKMPLKKHFSGLNGKLKQRNIAG